MGKSGRAMIEALIAGETNPTKLASLAHPRVKASPEKLREALRGRVTKHHRFLLRLHLNQIDALQAAMVTIDAQVEANLGPFRTAVELIMSIPGIKNLSAQVIVSEIGIDMSRFPSAAHLEQTPATEELGHNPRVFDHALVWQRRTKRLCAPAI
jgi:transposase